MSGRGTRFERRGGGSFVAESHRLMLGRKLRDPFVYLGNLQ